MQPSRRAGSEPILLRSSPSGAPLEVLGLVAGTYRISVETRPFAGPHFALPSKDSVRVVELAEGSLAHVELRMVLGGRVEVRLSGDRRRVGGDRWSLCSASIRMGAPNAWGPIDGWRADRRRR